MNGEKRPSPWYSANQPSLADEAYARETAHKRDVLTFAVGGEEYALGIDCIREIIKNRPVTEVPRVPAFVAGIIAVRGVVMPVIDVRLRLRLLAAPLSHKARILVVTRPTADAGGGLGGDVQDSGREPFGLIVDRVHQVVTLSEHDIEPPTMLAGHDGDFVSGIGRIHRLDNQEPRQAGGHHGGTGLLLSKQRHMLILLDLQRVLTFEHAGSLHAEAEREAHKDGRPDARHEVRHEEVRAEISQKHRSGKGSLSSSLGREGAS
jgi:chemotaxis signal transduction protein